MTTLINRRSALTAVAAFPAAFAIGAPLSFTEGKPGELASLIRRYFEEVKTFHDSDLVADDDYFLADAPFDATLRKMVGAPASTREDALAAITWIIFEGKESMIELAGDTLYGQVDRRRTRLTCREGGVERKSFEMTMEFIQIVECMTPKQKSLLREAMLKVMNGVRFEELAPKLSDDLGPLRG